MSVFYHTIYNANGVDYSPAGLVLLAIFGISIMFYATKKHGPVKQ